jgi:hypothetical protein
MVTIVFMGWNFSTLAPSLHPKNLPTGESPERSCERCHLRPWGRRGRRGCNGDLWVFPWKICRTPGHSTRIDGTSWRWGNVKKNTMWTLVLYCHPPKIDRTPNNFKILMISMICRLRVVEFILSRLPDDVIFGSAKDLVPTAQMMYNSSEQICGCFHFFLSHAFLNGNGSENGYFATTYGPLARMGISASLWTAFLSGKWVARMLAVIQHVAVRGRNVWVHTQMQPMVL